MYIIMRLINFATYNDALMEVVRWNRWPIWGSPIDSLAILLTKLFFFYSIPLISFISNVCVSGHLIFFIFILLFIFFSKVEIYILDIIYI